MVNTSFPELIVVLSCAVNVSSMFISIMGNTLVLTAVLRTPLLRSPSIILLCSLAVSDLFVGLAVQPVYVASLQTKNDSLSQALRVMVFSACGASLFAITAISVDRFLALHCHMGYPNLVTARRIEKGV